jgi:hypothetical protein
MILKLAALGFKVYLSDKFNIFDAIIITMSIIDISVRFGINSNHVSGQKAVMAFRGFRLLRIFKLAKSWENFQYLLRTIGASLLHMSSFTILLVVFILIYILFGLQLFGY